MGLNIAGQQFRNTPLFNSRPALYSMVIRDATGKPGLGYRFPLSPRAVRRQYVAMGNYYDVAGTSKQGGINRIVDVYGNTPFTFLIEGTTGWQQHNTDGGLTGLGSLGKLQEFLGLYAETNQAAQANNQPLSTLEFADSFLQSLWQVEPLGEQGYRQDSQQPLYITYSFRLVGIRDLGTPQESPNDIIFDNLNVTAASATTTLQAQMSTITTSYSLQTSTVIR